MHIRNWHICISGFRQHTGERTGMHTLWAALGELRSPETCVVLREWDADWEELADLIYLTVGKSMPRVSVYAYSYGGGYSFPRLARYLARRGILIHVAVLSDPVYRSRLLLGRWLAFMPWPRIRVPKNVVRVYSFCQRANYPRAHHLVAESRWTEIHPRVQVYRSHAFMDEAEEFHARCLKVAGVSKK